MYTIVNDRNNEIIKIAQAAYTDDLSNAYFEHESEYNPNHIHDNKEIAMHEPISLNAELKKGAHEIKHTV
jgi:hypothetical protein